MFNLPKHVGLSLVSDANGGWALLPWFPVNLDWNVLFNDDLKSKAWNETDKKNQIMAIYILTKTWHNIWTRLVCRLRDMAGVDGV